MNHDSPPLPDHFNQGAALRLFQDSVDAIILTDASGLIITANKRTFELLGYSEEELAGRNIATVYQDGQPLPDFSTHPESDLHVFDSVIPTKEGRKRLHIKVHARRYTLDDNDLVQWIHHDVTRQVELDRLRQDLAAMLVHDLQSPLGNVIASLELVKGELPTNSSPILHSMVDVAVRSSHHLQALVDSLLDISHLEAGFPLSNRVMVNVAKLIDYVYAVEEPDLDQRNITAHRDIGSDMPDILVEESMIRRVLLNLITNALKHSQRGQNITIKAQKLADQDVVLFSVTDQGQGVPEQYRELIFEKFQRVRTASSSNGLGLGLAFCRLAVEAHGGQIWVEDGPSGGAAFCFTVPAASDSDPAAPVKSGG
ncbi:MAG: PAS domain S-box protein [Chloroflexi bacterium]|jgi:PAS domain S-box-containing protein|nr:PAS domain S-box protein [Chloroflexota bacterium]